MNFIIWLVASCLCGIFGRLGGIGKPFNTKYRDLGCPLITYAYLLIYTPYSDLFGILMLLLAFGFTFGALTTYWDDVFGYDNFWFHGFICGLASFPLIWFGVGIAWWLILARAVILALLMGGWSKLWKNVFIEESGRYFFLTATMPLLII